MELLLQVNVIAKDIYFLDMLVRTVEIWLLRGVTGLHLASYFEIGSPHNIEYNIAFFFIQDYFNDRFSHTDIH